MDLLREVYVRLQYRDQYHLLRVSRLYANGFFKLRVNRAFWVDACTRQNIATQPTYTATQYEYWYALKSATLRPKTDTVVYHHSPIFDMEVFKYFYHTEIGVNGLWIPDYIAGDAVRTGNATADLLTELLTLYRSSPRIPHTATLRAVITTRNISMYNALRKITSIAEVRGAAETIGTQYLDFFFDARHEKVFDSPIVASHVGCSTILPHVLERILKYTKTCSSSDIKKLYKSLITYRPGTIINAIQRVGRTDEGIVMPTIIHLMIKTQGRWQDPDSINKLLKVIRAIVGSKTFNAAGLSSIITKSDRAYLRKTFY